jgi:hypothetical protein
MYSLARALLPVVLEREYNSIRDWGARHNYTRQQVTQTPDWSTKQTTTRVHKTKQNNNSIVVLLVVYTIRASVYPPGPEIK